MARFFFCGIGGIGMSAIALYLKNKGHTVSGSDRSFDNQTDDGIIKKTLINNGISIYPQDGSGVNNEIDCVITSSAIEDTIPDIKVAKALLIPIKRRAEILSEIFNQQFGIAIAGTSGKTTVTAMVGHILHTAQKNPTMINGGISLNTYNESEQSNLIIGNSNICVIEADESDGSIELYTPDIATILNVSLDHKPVKQILTLFKKFINQARWGAVINADDAELAKLTPLIQNVITFSAQGKSKATYRATHICSEPTGQSFKVNGQSVFLPMKGLHNIENALAAIATCQLAGVKPSDSIQALSSFRGTLRRTQLIGSQNGITVYDDYAHNPAKIKAVLDTFQGENRLFAIFQPHGYTPTRLMKDTLIEYLTENLSDNTVWIMPDIYYVGGTVQADISSQDIITPLTEAGKKALYLPTRSDILSYLQQNLQSGDTVIVMGGRDNTLTQFAEQICILGGHE